MANQNIETFLMSTNLNQNYKLVCHDVNNRTGVNIDRYPGMERQFQKMAQIVAKKCNANEAHLSNLNNKLTQESIKYFCQLINIKKTEKNKPPLDNRPINSSFNDQQGFSMLNKNNDISSSYNSLLEERNNSMRKNEASSNVFEQPIGESSRDANANDNTNLTKMLSNMMLERGQVNNDSRSPGIQPFNLNDDMANMLSNEPGDNLPLYQNINELQMHDSDNPMKRVEQIERERNEFNSVLKLSDMDNEKQQNILSKMRTSKGESDIVMERHMLEKHALDNTKKIDPVELYHISETAKTKMIDRMTNNAVSNNDVRSLSPLVDNILMEKLLTLQRSLQPDYMEKVHYIIVNSIDRDWFNNSNETRYDFRVKFNPGSENTSAGILDLYKNITSVELVNAIIPQDNVLIPFDARPYLDILHFPYLLLQIPEFSDVFRGTNSQNDKAFSVLIFDKQHDSSVLSNDYISGTDSIVNSAPTTQFYKEYRKTFYKFTPAYFEKKNYYNQPLGSLKQMTLKLATPAGENINVLNDVLTIADIDFTDVLSVEETTENNDYEYDVSHGFPYSNMSDHKYIRIESGSKFSNKLFRLGDNIKIRGYALTGSLANTRAFVSFINREEGHYILNTDITNLSNGNGTNQGFITNLYISPPGNLNSTLSGVVAGSYYDTDIDKSNYVPGTAKLINSNLQTHYLFKINTRDGDVQKVTMPMNI